MDGSSGENHTKESKMSNQIISIIVQVTYEKLIMFGDYEKMNLLAKVCPLIANPLFPHSD
jgi:hypothetical protein